MAIFCHAAPGGGKYWLIRGFHFNRSPPMEIHKLQDRASGRRTAQAIPSSDANVAGRLLTAVTNTHSAHMHEK